MGGGTSGIYRAKSLERLSSPERLDQLMQLVDRRSWIPLSTIGALLVLLLIWSVVGRIPMTVHGRGVLLQPRRVVELDAPGPGKLASYHVEVGDRVRAGGLLATISRPELETRLAALRDKRRTLETRARAARLLRSERSTLEGRSTRTKGDLLREHIATSRSIADALKAKALDTIREERAYLLEQRRMARELPERLRERVESQRRLHEEGILSRQELIEADETYMDSLRRVSDLEADLGALRTRELEVEEEYLNRLQRLADLTHELEMGEVRQTELEALDQESDTDEERELIDVAREIAGVEVLLEREGRIVSDHTGVVLELSAAIGAVVAPGERIGSLAVEDAGKPLSAVVYFSVRDGKRLAPGMRIGVTPDTVERERFGSILGTVDSVSPYPVSAQEAGRVVGNPLIAGSLIGGDRLIQVEASLEPDPEGDGFRWSSSRGPEVGLSAGTTAAARAVVEQRRPIAFVLPFLKSTAGVD